ncbi:MAG: PAS domain S-box protein [Methanospirillum sp.]|nr:PAS domain S-box protein [Methanospirillum sp.]
MVVVLYFDPDPDWRDRVERCRSFPSVPEIITAATFGEATDRLRAQQVDAVVADPPGTEVLALHSFVRLLPQPVPLVLFMQPGREALALRAVDGGGVRYVEKSGDPADRLRAVFALVESLCRRRDEFVSLQRRNEDLAFLSGTAMDLVRMDDDTNIYRYIAGQVLCIVPEGFANVLLFDHDSRLLTIHTILPEEPAVRVAREELGSDLVGKSFPIDADPTAVTMLGCNRMVEAITSLYHGMMQTLPEEACRRIEERLDIGRYYSMGFTCREGLYGLLTVALRKGRELGPEQQELIEVFVRQTAVALLHHHSRARLRESEARYRAVVESQHELVCRFRPDGTHLFANEAYCRFFGLYPASITGSRFVPEIPGEDQAVVRAYFAGFTPERPDGEIEHRVRLPGGRERWLEWSDRAFFDADGRLEEFQSVGRDVTGRKEAEAALAALTEDLEVRVEMATSGIRAANRDLEAFSHHVSHDLRGPLRAIDGFLGILMLKFGPELPPEAVELVGRAREGAIHANRFLEALLSLARLSSRPLSLEQVETAALVEDVLVELVPDPSVRRVEVTVGQLPPCRTDPEMLRHVWQNLVSNALKFTRTRDPARIRIDAGCEGGETVYRVADNGLGFPKEDAERIFEDFVRLHDTREFKGSGIGLPLVRRIVERHGGRVWADSEPGGGATFCFTLPAG